MFYRPLRNRELSVDLNRLDEHFNFTESKAVTSLL